MNAVIKGASYILAHVPGMVIHNGSTQITERIVNPESEYLKQLPEHLRTYQQAVEYWPNQVYIGNKTPEELAGVEFPYYDKPLAGAGRYGKFVACSGFPACRYSHPIVKDTGGKCPQCGGKMLLRKSAKGRVYYGCGSYPECKFMTWDEPTPEPCPQCGGTLFKHHGQLVCLKEGCGFTKPLEKK